MRALAGALAVAALVWAPPHAARGAAAAAKVERVDADTIAFPARVTAARFERRLLGTPGYHLIVWSGGGAAEAALFETAVSDTEVLDALESLGAQAGNALGLATWDERKDPRSAAPDAVIAGPPVELRVQVPGRAAPLAPADFLLDSAGRGFDLRFGGHRSHIGHWHSGCVVCLFSCPGSKVGNARYTVRDYVRGTTRFGVRPGVLPADGSEVTITLRLVRPSLPPPR